MKRRSFVKNIGALSVSLSLSQAVASDANSENTQFRLIKQLTLKEFNDEHEECPSLVTDQQGKSWLFSLRRLSYPQGKEVVSAFEYAGGMWQEIAPITKEAGQYEYPTADCAPGGLPCVSWSCLSGNSWCIEASVGTVDGFGTPYRFEPKKGKYIKPVLLAPSGKRVWLAWEKYEKGRFSICVTKYEHGEWAEPVEVDDPKESLFDPAMAQDVDGNLYVAYGITSGVHQNIEMKKLNGTSLKTLQQIPVAIGGGLANRVNINSHPVIAFDKTGRLWISWENNRKTHRLEDGDNFTGDRICAIVCYEDGTLKESSTGGKWLFEGKNDHLPTFFKDDQGELYIATHCGGDFTGNPFWKYRISRLNTQSGWTSPEMILETKQKGQTSRPAMIISKLSGYWLASRPEKWFQEGLENAVDPHRSRLSELELYQYKYDYGDRQISSKKMELKPTAVVEHLPDEKALVISGRKKINRRTTEHQGETYTLLIGNLHEHTEISSCWPAGCDGTIHDDYRFGMYSEGYDFMGITDHGYSLNEVYWRKNLRMANFYTDGENFVALPSLEWTLSNGRGNVEIKPGVGHKNVIFPTGEEALKFIRNKDEIYSVRNEETRDATSLWKFLHEKEVDCITIPHHPADEVHATDWEVHDEKYQPIVEIFQCRGNAEYPGCPRVINVTRHKPTPNPKAFIDYALADKGYQMGFIASGDHNGIGIGIAAVWVKEVSAKGIVEGLRNRRCFGTTGDKIFVNLTVNGSWANNHATIRESAPEIHFEVEAVSSIKSIEILRNSKVIKSIKVIGGLQQKGSFTDDDFGYSSDVLYYYLRVIQENKHIGWSSPVWVTKES